MGTATATEDGEPRTREGSVNESKGSCKGRGKRKRQRMGVPVGTGRRRPGSGRDSSGREMMPKTGVPVGPGG